MSTVQKPDISSELEIRDGIFDNNVDIEQWELPETNTFTPFIKNAFAERLEETMTTMDTTDTSDSYIRVWNAKEKEFTKIRPFKHQLFVKNYLNTRSPYRGLLLYHGLGSGKSGASVIIAEGFSDRSVVVMLPASLATNYKTEILTFGTQSYKIKNHWQFVPYNLGKSSSQTVDERNEIYREFEELGIPQRLLNKLNIRRKKEGYQEGIWLINTVKKYPNYITREEKEELEEFQRENADDQDDEVIEILSDGDKKEIQLQINTIYNYKYKFVHTNAGSSTITNILKLHIKFKSIKKKLFGASKKNSTLTKENKLQIIEYMYKENLNPFDNKVVIMDEIHNFAASVASNGFNAPLIYELLMRAKNLKLVLLSGTPVINNAYEIAIICNLLKGFTITYECSLQSTITDMDTFTQIIRSNKSIYNFNLENKTLEVVLNPNSFENVEDSIDNFSVIIKKDLREQKDNFMASFQAYMKKNNYPLLESYTTNYYTLFDDILTGDSSQWWKRDLRMEHMLSGTDTPLPELNPFRLMSNIFKKKNMTKFSDKYINLDDLSVVNTVDFKRRILGIISFYNEVASYDKENPIFPGIIYADEVETNVVMSDYQFKLYVQEREVERKYEDIGKKLSQIETIFNTANLFKVYSRTMGIIVFPPLIERPRHSKLRRVIRSENPDIVEYSSEEKKLLEKLYIQKRLDALAALTKRNLQYTESTPSEPYNLPVLSPKYTLLLKNILQTPGLVFCYSQFRSIEGIGLFVKVLECNGYYAYNPTETEEERTTKKIIVQDKVRFEISEHTWGTFTVFKIEHEKDSSVETLYHLLQANGEMITTTRDKIYRCYFSLWTGEEDVETRKQLLIIFNKESNKYGTESLILLTTSAGAEGISLMNVRQVHILEPYWNNVRIKQVIGRARRVRSHIKLPKEQRNVKIFQYVIRFSKQQLNGTWLENPLVSSLEEEYTPEDDETTPSVPIMTMSEIISQKDKGLTSDETLYNIANTKTKILDKFLKLFKEVAVDCEFNKEDNIQTEDNDVSKEDFVCYTELEEEDKEDSISLNIFSENAETDMVVIDDSAVVKEKTNVITINQPTLANGVHLHSIILDVPFEYSLHTYLEQNIGKHIPLYNFYSYYSLNTPSSQKKIIGYIFMNAGKTLSLTNMDIGYFTFDILKQYIEIEEAIKQIDSTIKSPLQTYSDDITPSETIKWTSYVKEKIKELQSRKKWVCKICKKEYSVDIHSCRDHPNITKQLCLLLENKKLKKSLRIIS